MDFLVDALQATVGGLGAGALYALMALGLVLIYRATHVVNFGHGDVVATSAFVALVSFQWFPLWVALVVGIGVGAMLGAASERGLMRPAAQRGAGPLALVVISLGIGLFLNGVNGLLFGHTIRSFPSPWSGGSWLVGGVVIPWSTLGNFLVGALLAGGLFLWFRTSLVGLGVRAVLEAPEMARLLGIPADRVRLLSWSLGTGLGGVAGILAAPMVYLEPNAMLELLIKGFAAAVLGGLTSLPGAVLGGCLLGVAENLVALVLGTELKTLFAFALIVLTLVFRPEGLLGRPAYVRV